MTLRAFRVIDSVAKARVNLSRAGRKRGSIMEKTVTRLDPTLPVVPRKKRVAAYARVSSGKEAMIHSLSAQVSYFNNRIQRHPGWSFAGVYADEGISATNTKKREGFNRMIRDALAGSIDLIVTKSVSRFARNTVDTLTTIRKLKEKGVGVMFEKE